MVLYILYKSDVTKNKAKKLKLGGSGRFQFQFICGHGIFS